MRSAFTVWCAGGVLGMLVATGCGTSSNGTGGDGSSTQAGGGGSTSSSSAGVATTAPTSTASSTQGTQSTTTASTTTASATTSSHAGAPDAAATSDASGDDAIAAARVLCVQIINQDRATLMPPSAALTENTSEESCVDQQAQADYTANTAHSAFGNCKEQAQDECPDWGGTPSEIMTKCLAQMWAEGPPAKGQDNHWLNMSNAKYTKVACGFYQTPTGNWWATQDFWP
jgi:hypothetical protein